MAATPNVLLITSDQQHHSTLGCVNPKIRTPNLDRLAREGTQFTRAYCNNPLCSPSRSTIITGMYPAWHGCWTIGVKLPEDVPTVGDVFQDHGYATHLVGKAHFQPLRSEPDDPEGGLSLESQPTLRDLDFWRRFTGPWYGFERIDLLRCHTNESHCGQHYAIWMEDQGLKNWPDYFAPWPAEPKPRGGAHWDDWPRRWEIPEQYHYNHFIAQRTIAHIEAALDSGRPFFTWASYMDPHYPQTVPEPWYSMYDPDDMEPGTFEPGEFDHMPPPHQMTRQQNPDYSQFNVPHGAHGYHSHLKTEDRAWLRRLQAVYYGMVSFMDASIGRILGRLDELGVADNTLIVYTTDHGDFLGQHGLHMKGAFHYEDLLRLPFLVRFPGRVPAGRTCAALQGLVDLAPTFLSACGMRIPGIMQGVDQMPVWRGQADAARDHVIVENRHNTATVHLRTYVNRRYKLTLYRDRPWGELFDLEQDPQERRNRFDDPAYAQVRSELMRQWLNSEIAREPTRMQRIAGA